ncbi:hypothetical protein PI125_g24772, partial [Phytophthora idaei]
ERTQLRRIEKSTLLMTSKESLTYQDTKPH